MPIELNHTIVYVEDQEVASAFLTDLFDLPAATRFGPFHVVEVDNGVSLDYISTDDRFDSQHFAFLVSEDEFSDIFARIVDAGIEYWADPSALETRRDQSSRRRSRGVLRRSQRSSLRDHHAPLRQQ